MIFYRHLNKQPDTLDMSHLLLFTFKHITLQYFSK